MNYTRIVLAAVAATVVDAVYGFIVYGNILSNQFAQYMDVYRPVATQGTYMPFLFGGMLLAMLAASFIYAKGYEGGSGVAEGARFGFLIGILEVGYSVLVSYAILNIGRRLTAYMGAAAIVEWVIAGIVIGLIYGRRK